VQQPGSPGLLSVSALKARGWTDTLIRDFLGPPDHTRPHPHYRSAAPMRLYARSRVEAVEASAAWAHVQDRAGRRKAAAAKAVQTKTTALRVYLDQLRITVPVMPMAQLTARACAHYNDRQWEFERWDGPEATPASEPGFLARITAFRVE
jgi:hypothetical protein